MKKTVALCALVCGALLTSMSASTNPQFESATVVSVESSPATNFDGGTSTDAPLRPEIHSYNIGVKMGNQVYQLAYDSAFEDASPLFTANQLIQARLKGNVLNVQLPGNRTVPMAIKNRTAAEAGLHSQSN